MDKDTRIAWARQEFSTLDLDHAARTACAVEVLANMGRGSGTRVTDFTQTDAERQQAYGFLENDSVVPSQLTFAASEAALSRIPVDDEFCVVAVDGSSLKLADEYGAKGFGRVGSFDSTRGLLVQTALAISGSGVPVGILAQKYWARSLEKAPKRRAAKNRAVQDKETHHWLDVAKTAEEAANHVEMAGRLWFQLDRGYDSSAMMDWMADSANRCTIRGEYNRALWSEDTPSDSEADAELHNFIKDALDAAPVLSEMALRVEGNPDRTARMATMEVQVAKVNVRLSDPSRRKSVKGKNGKRRPVDFFWPRTLTAVRAREAGTTPAGEKPLQWMLWVNFTVDSVHLAQTVVRMYSYRWRIEEFHRMWKSGAMKVEQTQARSGENVERIARLSAIVACRILRLTRLARDTPDAPASDELSRTEITVLTQMDPRSPKQAPRPQKPGSLAWAIAVIADMGGYTGKSSGGPPGPMVVARGFQRMRDRAEGFDAAIQSLKNRDQW